MAFLLDAPHASALLPLVDGWLSPQAEPRGGAPPLWKVMMCSSREDFDGVRWAKHTDLRASASLCGSGKGVGMAKTVTAMQNLIKSLSMSGRVVVERRYRYESRITDAMVFDALVACPDLYEKIMKWWRAASEDGRGISRARYIWMLVQICAALTPLARREAALHAEHDWRKDSRSGQAGLVPFATGMYLLTSVWCPSLNPSNLAPDTNHERCQFLDALYQAVFTEEAEQDHALFDLPLTRPALTKPSCLRRRLPQYPPLLDAPPPGSPKLGAASPGGSPRRNHELLPELTVGHVELLHRQSNARMPSARAEAAAPKVPQQQLPPRAARASAVSLMDDPDTLAHACSEPNAQQAPPPVPLHNVHFSEDVIQHSPRDGDGEEGHLQAAPVLPDPSPPVRSGKSGKRGQHIEDNSTKREDVYRMYEQWRVSHDPSAGDFSTELVAPNHNKPEVAMCVTGAHSEEVHAAHRMLAPLPRGQEPDTAWRALLPPRSVPGGSPEAIALAAAGPRGYRVVTKAPLQSPLTAADTAVQRITSRQSPPEEVLLRLVLAAPGYSRPGPKRSVRAKWPPRLDVVWAAVPKPRYSHKTHGVFCEGNLVRNNRVLEELFRYHNFAPIEFAIQKLRTPSATSTATHGD
eukprot:TRINITY_DN32504_c0_g1_i1.p1 TRINITY_DN32504_c0_g1~~TRINITY_DN32504_c0_g1_i1.p1  ORF type:complete len:634 (+),score=207.93 TRINITY_DN32504_c0_g1_i1:148-2049(+)